MLLVAERTGAHDVDVGPRLRGIRRLGSRTRTKRALFAARYRVTFRGAWNDVFTAVGSPREGHDSRGARARREALFARLGGALTLFPQGRYEEPG